MVESEAFIDQMIANQNRAIKYYTVSTAILVFLGILIVAAALWSSARLVPDAFKGLLGLGGAFVSTLSAFPLKEILSRKERIGAFRVLKVRLGRPVVKDDARDDAERKRVEDMLWKVVEKTLGGG
jgi:hypothetical protein